MDLRNTRRYSNEYIQPQFLHKNEPYIMSARESYISGPPVPPGIIHHGSDPFMPNAPVMVYTPISAEIEHLNRTAFLENRIRIQQNIINKHKTEAERSLAKGKQDNVVSRQGSLNDLTKKSYSDIFRKSNKPGKTNGNISQDNSNMEDVWMPTDVSVDIHGRTMPYPVPETMDTARGKAKYALVRLNSTGNFDVPQMFVENINPLDNTGPYNQQMADFKPSAVKHRPQNQYSYENRAILQKVNGIEKVPDGYEGLVKDTGKGSRENSSKIPDTDLKKLSKKNSKITLGDLNEPGEHKNPLLSRKSKSPQKTQNKVMNDINSHINAQHPVINSKPGSKDRRLSRDSNQTTSTKNSLINSRQSSVSWGKNSHTNTPLSFSTPDMLNENQNTKLNRGKKDTKYKNVENEIVRQNIAGHQSPNKKKQTSDSYNDKSDVTQSLKKTSKNVKADDRIQADKFVANGKDMSKTGENKVISTKKAPKPDRTYDKNKEINSKALDIAEQQQQSDKGRVLQTKKPMDMNGKQKATKMNQKSKNPPKHGVLRKTDSFKMMGNSSQFFGYCSVPEEETTKQPKSILKKPKNKPDRPDTA